MRGCSFVRREQEDKRNPSRPLDPRTFSFFLSLHPHDYTLPPLFINLVIKSERSPEHAELLLLSRLGTVSVSVSVCFAIHIFDIFSKTDVRAISEHIIRIALTASDIRPHATRKTHSLLMSSEAVARARTQFRRAAWRSQRPVCVVSSLRCLGVCVGEVVLSSSGSAALELAGSGTSQGCCLVRERRWRRKHGELLRRVGLGPVAAQDAAHEAALSRRVVCWALWALYLFGVA
jgi:hypothetical protein